MEPEAEMPSGLTARAGRVADADALAALMFVDPGREAVATTGSVRAAQRFSALLFRHALEQDSSSFVIAEHEHELAGFAQLSSGGDMAPFTVLASAAIRAMGPVGAVRAGWRSRARMRVDLSGPEGGVHLVELHVSPRLRNRGVGAFLLDRVDAYAERAHAAHISLTTASDNPARRLYERSGYRVTGEKADEGYERLTGSAGRILMVKPVG